MYKNSNHTPQEGSAEIKGGDSRTETVTFASKLKFWNERDLTDRSEYRSSDMVYPTLDICDSSQLEVQDKKHRRGFVLREKKQHFDQVFGRTSAFADQPWRNDFWSWLNECAEGRQISSVQGIQKSERNRYLASFRGNR